MTEIEVLNSKRQEIEKEFLSPNMIDQLIDIYKNRKFCEDIDYLEAMGGKLIRNIK